MPSSSRVLHPRRQAHQDQAGAAQLHGRGGIGGDRRRQDRRVVLVLEQQQGRAPVRQLLRARADEHAEGRRARDQGDHVIGHGVQGGDGGADGLGERDQRSGLFRLAVMRAKGAAKISGCRAARSSGSAAASTASMSQPSRSGGAGRRPAGGRAAGSRPRPAVATAPGRGPGASGRWRPWPHRRRTRIVVCIPGQPPVV